MTFLFEAKKHFKKSLNKRSIELHNKDAIFSYKKKTTGWNVAQQHAEQTKALPSIGVTMTLSYHRIAKKLQ